MDKDSFDDFYRATSRRLLQYAYAMCGELGLAQDLTQEAYVRAWQRWRRISAYDHPEGWLRLIVARLAADRWRRIGVHRRVHAQMRPPDPVPPPSEDGGGAGRGAPADSTTAASCHRNALPVRLDDR